MSAEHRPNIVFILIDDLGWRDLACYGSAFYETPNIDRLACEGMMFTDAYAACPVCSPTRGSILTGRYPARIGVTNYIDWVGRHHPCRGRVIDVPYFKQLPLEEKTIARALGAAGYATWHVGKWHLGGESFYPDRHGFEANVGGCEWGLPMKGYFSPWRIPTLSDGPEGQHLGDRLTEEAIGLIRRNTAGGAPRPFYLNLCYYDVHTPIQNKPEIVAKYREKIRRLGLDKVQALVEGEPFHYESGKNRRMVRRIVQSDPVYAAMVENLDTNVGKLLSALEELRIIDDTLVIFTSDNGGLSTAEGSPTCNAPLAEGKGWMYEGGTREPLLARWPGIVPARSRCSVPVTSPDFYPTLLDAAGLPLEPERHCDGVSLLPLLCGGLALDREAIYWHFPHYANEGGTPGASVRAGNYKLIEFLDDGLYELYDLSSDPSERYNLIDQRPDVAARLRKLLKGWQASVEATFPEKNPDYRPWGPQRAEVKRFD